MHRPAKAQQGAKKDKGKPITRAPQREAALAFMEEVSALAPDVAALLSLVAARAQQLTGASGAIVAMRDQHQVLRRAAVGSAALLLDGRTGLDGQLSPLALALGPACEASRPDSPARRAPFEELGMQSVVHVPVRSLRANVGILAVTSPHPGAFKSEHQGDVRSILQVLARILTWRLEFVEQLQGYRDLLTENDIALATLRESEDRFRSSFDHSGIGMALLARDGRWLKVNAALCRTLGYSRQELLVRDHQSTTHPEDVHLEQPFLERLFKGEISSYELEKRYVHKDRSVIWGLLTISMVKTPEQQALYLIAQIQDITARKATEESLQKLAVRDDLTGLCNRREMFRLLKEESSRSDRHCRPMSLIMLDVDAFKNVNDTYGHQAGDASLRQIARIVEECVRSFDRVARYGGEEFAVILPETLGVEALVVAERIRVRVAAEEFSVGDKAGGKIRIPLTVSSGIATMTGERATSVEDIIREADASLYAAKKAGRNRCVAGASALGHSVSRREGQSDGHSDSQSDSQS